MERPGLPPAYALGAYRGAARRAVLAYKERGRRELAACLGQALAAAVPAVVPTAVPAARLAGVPPASSAVVPVLVPTAVPAARLAGVPPASSAVVPVLTPPAVPADLLAGVASSAVNTAAIPGGIPPPTSPVSPAAALTATSAPITTATAGRPPPDPAKSEARAGPLVLVPAPSRPAAARQRGGQHMVAVAERCAASLRAAGIPATVARALRLDGRATDSVGLDAAGRAANLAGRLRPVPARAPPPGAQVLLLDDVITTGATAAACVSALASVGATVTAILAITAAG